MRYLLIILSIFSMFACQEPSKKEEVIVRQNICEQSLPETSASKLPFSGISKISDTAQTSITIHWKHIEGFELYHVISYNKTGRKILKSVAAPNSSITLKNLVPDSEYEFLVRAMDKSGFIEKNSRTIKIKTKPWPRYINQKSVSFQAEQSINLGPSRNFIKKHTASFSFWLKPNFSNLQKDSRLITLHEGPNAKASLSLALGSERISLIYLNSKGKTKKVKHKINLEDNHWHHLVLTIKPELIKVYLDEIEIISLENQKIKLGSHAAHLGAFTADQKSFSGYIDEVIFLNMALNPLQISQLYKDRAQTDPRNLIAPEHFNSWYRMGDSAGDDHLNIEDMIGDNNGTPFQMTPENLVIVTP